MGQSLSQIYVHLIFSTKERRPWIDGHFQENMHAYIVGTLRELNSPSLIVNSRPEHVHILYRQASTADLSKIVEEVKKSSSKWVKEQSPEHLKFAWQSGYGAFSVSSSMVEVVKEYIANQKEHHRTTTFKEEFRAFLDKHGVEFDERYVFD